MNAKVFEALLCSRKVSAAACLLLQHSLARSRGPWIETGALYFPDIKDRAPSHGQIDSSHEEYLEFPLE